LCRDAPRNWYIPDDRFENEFASRGFTPAFSFFLIGTKPLVKKIQWETDKIKTHSVFIDAQPGFPALRKKTRLNGEISLGNFHEIDFPLLCGRP